jgi:hypothetical protein
MVLSVWDLEREQEEGDDVEEEPGYVADPVVDPGELLCAADASVIAPLGNERRNDQQPADCVGDDREEDVDSQRGCSQR